MTWSVEINLEAQKDIVRIRKYLAKQSRGAPVLFLKRFREEEIALGNHPFAFAKIGTTARFCKLRKMKYAIFFLILPANRVEIFAVLHTSRSAKKWLKRI